MINTGNDNPDQVEAEKPKTSRFGSLSRSPIVLAILGIVLAGSALIGYQAFGILYSIIFPPKPPIPENVTEMRHTNIDYGVDEWLYGTDQNACEIVQYYISQDGNCRITANICEGNKFDFAVQTAGQHIASCSGTEDFSIFAMRWEANIGAGYNTPSGSTQFSVSREVFWTGEVPPRLDPKTGLELGE